MNGGGPKIESADRMPRKNYHLSGRPGVQARAAKGFVPP